MIHFAQEPVRDEPHSEPWHPELLASVQQYLQALQSRAIPPHDLHEAWDTFYQTYDPLVRRTVSACRVRQADVGDCIQEAWTEIATKLPGLRYDLHRGRFASWLRIVVHRATCHHARRVYCQMEGRIDQDLSALTCSRILGPAKASQREEVRTSVRETLDTFRTRVTITALRVLVLTAAQGHTSTEISERLGISAVNVRVIRHRTAQKFRQFVADQPRLADAFGVSPPLPNAAAETRENQSSHELSKAKKFFQPL